MAAAENRLRATGACENRDPPDASLTGARPLDELPDGGAAAMALLDTACGGTDGGAVDCCSPALPVEGLDG